MKIYKTFDLLGLLFSIASLATVFMILPPLFLAPIAIAFSLTAKVKGNQKAFTKVAISISAISLLIVAILFMLWSGLQIAP